MNAPLLRDVGGVGWNSSGLRKGPCGCCEGNHGQMMQFLSLSGAPLFLRSLWPHKVLKCHAAGLHVVCYSNTSEPNFWKPGWIHSLSLGKPRFQLICSTLRKRRCKKGVTKWNHPTQWAQVCLEVLWIDTFSSVYLKDN